MNRNAKAFVTAATIKFGDNPIVTRDQIQQVCDESGAPFPYWLITKKELS